jgi:peptidoglycan DL-endopeptidase CwlO
VRRDASVRIILLAISIFTGLVGALVGVATPAAADPNEENGTPASLTKELAEASRGYLDAKAALERSQARQKQLSAQLAVAQVDVVRQSAAVDELAAAAYKAAGLGTMVSILDSGTPESFLDRITLLDAVATNEQRTVQQLADTRDGVAQAKAEIDREVAKQQAQVKEMNRRKEQAERALRAAGGGAATGRFTGTSNANATPAPRNSDGSWPRESCRLNDPTTSGCVTPRLLHAYQQARRAGFTRYCSCYRSSGSGEHPRGRACDFAAQKSGFGGVATGGDRTYGNNLAAYFIRNAGRLGVLYVIWYRQIWLPSSGWRSYSGRGSPSAEHTNHVHLSVY